MADFRKWYPVLAVAALMFGSAASANAQPAFSCSTNAGVPPIVRAEGITELVGDLILNCTGGTPTPIGTKVPRVNFQIFLNTNVTSRLLSGAGDGGFNEALLMIDEPSGSATNLKYCQAVGGCEEDGVGGAGISYSTSAGIENVYPGRPTGSNQIVWLGVPIDPPGTTATRIIRITNVRANASQLGTSSTLIPTQIVMFVSATSTTSVPINQPQQTVAFIQPGLSVSTRKISSSYLQCVSNNKNASTDSSKSLEQGYGSVVRFTEGFASAFKRRNSAVVTSSADASPTPIAQNNPNSNLFTETGFYNPDSTIGAFGAAGLADHGTRLMVKFTNIPAGMSLYASAYGVASSTTPAITATYTSTPNSLSVAPTIRLVSTDANGAGAFSAAPVGNTSSQSAPITISNGTGTAVFEVLNSDPFKVETVEVGIGVAFTANTSTNLPALGTASVSGSFAPLSTVTTSSSTAPIPRFVDTAVASSLFTLNACTTNILFPFLTNQVGFDSGMAIANTSTDPFGTAPQAGPCKLNYYGETTGGGAAPAAQTSAVVPSGKVLTATLSSGGNYGVAATPGFQGYVIAQCSFQYAHGFAFISDVGANRISEAYLGLIMDSSLGSRTGFVSETLSH